MIYNEVNLVNLNSGWRGLIVIFVSATKFSVSAADFTFHRVRKIFNQYIIGYNLKDDDKTNFKSEKAILEIIATKVKIE